MKLKTGRLLYGALLQFVVAWALVLYWTSSVTSSLVASTKQSVEAQHEASEEASPSMQPLVHLFGERDECRLSSGLEFLGRGNDGHVYAASMVCTNRNKKTPIAIKVPTRHTSNIGNYYVVNEDAKTWNQRKELFQRMMSKNSSKDVLNRYFTIHLGSIELPLEMLRDTNRAGNHHGAVKAQRQGLIVNSTDNQALQNHTIKAQVFRFTDGEKTDNILKSNSFPQTGRQQIVRDLVFMYKYMYERDIVHCDISARHILYSGSRRETSLIDFERFLTMQPDTKDRTKIKMAQLWQLLVLIANMCTYAGGKPEFRPKNNVCIKKNLNAHSVPFLDEHVRPAMEQCGFAGQLDWSRFDLKSTRQAYEILSDWSRY